MSSVITAFLYRFCWALSAAWCIMVSGLVLPPAAMPAEAIYPHWTGKHCTECHVTAEVSELQFGGNVVELCNRCHGSEPPVCTRVHGQNSVFSDTMQDTIPDDWPRSGGVISCLTCHAVKLQMRINSVAQKENSAFLRGSEPGDLVSFCYNCHDRMRFQQTNPHQGSMSSADQSPCYRCHTGALATGFEICFEASLKTKSPSLCLGCHGKLAGGHAVHERLAAQILEKYHAPLLRLEDEGIELPLAEGRMHCATCHNPHPEGIIGRKEAAIGGGEEHFLRMERVRDMCRVCHEEESIEEYIERFTSDVPNEASPRQ